MNGAPTQRSRTEQGFTLIELLVVVLIILVLTVIAVVGMRSARTQSRIEAMQSAAAIIDQSIGTFNRMYPPTPTLGDQLVSRNGGVWTGNTGAATAGLTDETGEWLLRSWPKNPYAGGGVVIRRYASSGSCASGVAGEVRVCRIAAGQQRYLIRAWARNSKGQSVQVYNATHGTA